MQDFAAILGMLGNFMVYILSVRIPLGSDYSISFGSMAIGLAFFVVLLKIIPMITGSGGSDND